MTAELAPVALCSAGASISAEVLQLSHADLGLLTLPEQVRNHSDLCPPACSFFCSCLVSALLFLCFGFLKCAQWELRPALRQTPVKAWVQPQLPAGLLAQLQPAAHNHCSPLLGLPTPAAGAAWAWSQRPQNISAHRFASPAVPQGVSARGTAQGAWVGEAGSLLQKHLGVLQTRWL